MPEGLKKYEGRGFYLRQLGVEEVGEKYLKWVTDPEVNEFLAVKYDQHSVQSLKDFVATCNASDARFLYGVFAADNTHIGNFSIYNINRINKTFDFGYFIGEKEWWGKDAGLSCCLIGLGIAFDAMALRKTFTYVESINLKSRFVLQKIGFEKEAVLKERVLNKDTYVDSIIYSLNEQQWREIIKPKYKIA
jgi:ribosomal-protein-alanine N-acetyltransferase